MTPTIKDLFIAFFRLGLTAFGGPAMIAHIRELSTQRNQWLDKNDFKNGVALCQSIPGATAIQAAAYVGLRVRLFRKADILYIVPIGAVLSVLVL